MPAIECQQCKKLFAVATTKDQRTVRCPTCDCECPVPPDLGGDLKSMTLGSALFGLFFSGLTYWLCRDGIPSFTRVYGTLRSYNGYFFFFLLCGAAAVICDLAFLLFAYINAVLFVTWIYRCCRRFWGLPTKD